MSLRAGNGRRINLNGNKRTECYLGKGLWIRQNGEQMLYLWGRSQKKGCIYEKEWVAI